MNVVYAARQRLRPTKGRLSATKLVESHEAVTGRIAKAAISKKRGRWIGEGNIVKNEKEKDR